MRDHKLNVVTEYFGNSLPQEPQSLTLRTIDCQTTLDDIRNYAW